MSGLCATGRHLSWGRMWPTRKNHGQHRAALWPLVPGFAIYPTVLGLNLWRRAGAMHWDHGAG